MKKILKVLLYISIAFVLLLFALSIYLFAITSGTKLDKTKLVNLDNTITYYDINGEIMSEEANYSPVTSIADIPTHVKNAFVAIEDKRFYSHNGIDTKGLFRATLNNIKSLSLKEGASTISQQLIKNTHLSSEKTFKRKIIEMKLAIKLEKEYSKKEILEMYLNTIYFGENCFGITEASQKYFSKSPAELSINEGATLAAIVKAPSHYSPTSNIEKCYKRKNLVLSEMKNQGYISDSEYNENVNKNITLNYQEENNYGYLYLAKKEFTKHIESARFLSKKFNVYTNYNPTQQNLLNEIVNSADYQCDKTAVLMDKYANVIAYMSTCGEIYRPLGSTIKPLLVYAPAIETNTVDSCTLINDEKTNFNGYTPSNYNDKYYGNVSVKTALTKSLNVCAVKILNYTGIDRSLNFLKKTDIEISNDDKGLSLALGATEKGATLTQIASAYCTFNNEGNFNTTSCINKIEDDNGNIIYRNIKKNTNIFSADTVTIINDMLKNVVNEGTAKKLSFNQFPLYAKTGTVGNEKGNTDAYTISYSSDYTLGVWFGNYDNSLLNNSITGGSYPAQYSSLIWDSVYKYKEKPKEINTSEQVEEIYLDSISYEQLKIEIADDVAPSRYKTKFLFKKSHLPTEKSTRFSLPIIENVNYTINNNEIWFDLSMPEYQNAKIYRENNGYKICVYDTIAGEKIFIDKSVKPDDIYFYSIIPYYNDGITIHYGKEVLLDKIKTPRIKLGANNWWENEFD